MNCADLRCILRYYIETSPCCDLRAYGRSFLDHYERALYSLNQMMRLGKMRSARVLDVGCGYGWHALAVSLLGNNVVVANDVRPLMIMNMKRQLAAVRGAYGVCPRVHALLGDFTRLDIEKGLFDAILCNQTIEHIHDLDSFFRKCHAALRVGGTLVIGDDNNCLNHRHLRRIEEMWDRRDRSWAFVEELKRARPEENKEIRPYAVMRAAVIIREFPRLSAQSLDRLVWATAGQREDEIVSSVRNYLRAGSLPDRPKYSWCRNPITGEYCERQFDPFALKEELSAAGFRARLLQDMRRGGPMRVLTRVDVPWANRVLFKRRCRFVLAARKE